MLVVRAVEPSVRADKAGVPVPSALPDTRTAVRGTLAVLGVLLSFGAIYLLGTAFFCVALGWVVATAVIPVVDRLGDHGIPRWMATTGVFLTLMALSAGILFLVVPGIWAQAMAVVDGLPGFCHSTFSPIAHSPYLMLARAARQLSENLCRPSAKLSPDLADGSTVSWDGVRTGLWALLATGVFAYYWVLDRAVVVRTAAVLCPEPAREQLLLLVRDVEGRIGAFVRAQLILQLIVGLAAWGAYHALGLPNALALGTITGLLETVPLVGPLLALSLAALTALSIKPILVFALVAIAVGFRIAVDYLIVPVFFGRSMGVNPLLLLLTFLVLGELGGIPGVMIAVPTSAIVQLIFQRWAQRVAAAPEGSSPATRDAQALFRYEALRLAADARRLALTGTEASARTLAWADEVEGVAVELALRAAPTHECEPCR